MGKEFELKYQASSEILQKIQEKLGDFHAITMETHYYDAPDGSLQKLRWTLRRRLENGVSICGLKTPGKNLIRGEWEARCSTMEEGLAALCAMDVPEEFPRLVSSGVREVCGARFTRLAKIMPTQDGTVEVALDQGVFLGGSKEQPFSELEVELKSGSRQAAEQFAEMLAEEYGLHTFWISKYERAMALAEGE